MIYNLCLASIDEIKELFHSDYDDYELNLKDRIEKANKYIKDIKEEGNWAGDIEINKMAEVLELNILCYTKDENALHLQAVYFGTDSKINLIPLRFINNNHFELLYPKNYNIRLKKINYDEEIFKDRIAELKNNKISNNNNMKNIPAFFNCKYVDYIYNNHNKYNEIYDYLKYNKIPHRIEAIIKPKKRQKKRSKFREQAKLFKIENNRLYIKKEIVNKNHKRIASSESNNNINDISNNIIKSIEKISLEDNIKETNKLNLKKNQDLEIDTDSNNLNIEINKSINLTYKLKDKKYVWKKIPCKNEVMPICEEIHLSTNHGGINKCQNALSNSEFYWEGYSTFMYNVIKNCSKCATMTKNISEKPIMRHIIPDGPHFRYQADIWEFSRKIFNKFTYKYVLEIKDCFSKWMWCYPLTNKEGSTVLCKIKSFFTAFGPPKILQTDNGLEFCNIASALYLENLNVNHVRSSPRYPESNGQIEAQHKTLQKQIELNLNKISNDNDLIGLIYDTLYEYNYKTIHSSTGYKPIDIKDITDTEIINNVKLNINNKYKQFHDDDSSKYNIGDKYLLIDNGIISNNSNIINKPKIKHCFYSIPVSIISANEGGLLKIKIEKDNKYYKFGEIYKVNYKLLKKCTDEVWNKLIGK